MSVVASATLETDSRIIVDFNHGQSRTDVQYEPHATNIRIGDVRLATGYDDVTVYVLDEVVWRGSISEVRKGRS